MDTNTNLIELQFDQSTQMILRDSAKWAKLFAICGFLLCAVFIGIGIFSATVLSTFQTSPYNGTNVGSIMRGTVAGIYIIFALLYFFPFLFLFRFSSRMQAALRSHDQQTLVRSLGNLRAYFRFVGILLIIGLSFCVVAFIFGGLAASLSGKGM